MKEPLVSVVIPTHNRPATLVETLGHLEKQTLNRAYYEIIVVDDGSSPPVTVAPPVRLVRLEGEERSAARNAGAKAARGELLVFIDDDITVDRDFLKSHLEAHREWPDALLVGAIRLPGEASATPFGRFRQKLEDNGIPVARGITAMPNLCTAANMAMTRARFAELGGFDPRIASGEDQDLALRHTTSGGRIAFIPAATVIHRDNAMDVRSYCRRAEWGSRMMLPFCRRYPHFVDNITRRRVNGSFNLLKSLLSIEPVRGLLFAMAGTLERTAPDSAVLDRLYRGLLGVHIYRGYRDGDRNA
ncbi:MAG: glycosyltransferase [Acidobacteriota bacterium]